MKFDLLVTGGDVLDPGAGLRGVMDIGIVGGKIAAVAPSLPSISPGEKPARASMTCRASAGYAVVVSAAAGATGAAGTCANTVPDTLTITAAHSTAITFFDIVPL